MISIFLKHISWESPLDPHRSHPQQCHSHAYLIAWIMWIEPYFGGVFYFMSQHKCKFHLLTPPLSIQKCFSRPNQTQLSQILP